MTPWDAWLHPRRAARTANEEYTRAENAIEQSTSLKNEVDSLHLQLSEIQKAKDEAERLAAESTQSVEILTAELIKTRQELDEEREITARIENLEKQFEQVIEMKEHYENRIKRLKTALADARRALKIQPGYISPAEEIVPIDMTKTAPEPVPPPVKSQKPHQPPALSQKFRKPAVTPSLFSATRSTQSDLTSQQESGEWLMTLPDDLPLSEI